jgi:hypothetical protein
MRSNAALLGIALLLTLTTLAVISHAEDGQQQITITGDVETADRDEQDMPTAVSIFDIEWGDVLIAPAGKGKELLKQVGAFVEATGDIEELTDNGDFTYQLTVKSYTILEQSPDSSHDESEVER